MHRLKASIPPSSPPPPGNTDHTFYALAIPTGQNGCNFVTYIRQLYAVVMDTNNNRHYG
jgi:hypothetical protein